MTFTKYLRVENKARFIPSIEYLSGLGVSSSRGDEDKIGQFGSGFPNMLALFGREGILKHCKLCMGLDVYTFLIVDKPIRDGDGEEEVFKFIRMKKQGGGVVDLNISTAFGELDWTDVAMGVREIISNGIDGAMQFDKTLSSFRMELVPAEARQTRAKEDRIRFYIPLTDEISEYYNDIKKTFICLNSDYVPGRQVIPNHHGGPAFIYRKGVKVGQFGKESLFHYNINDIEVKESRNVDSSNARDAAATALCRCGDADIYAKFLKNVVNPATRNTNLWETWLPTYELNLDNQWGLGEEKKEELTKNWRAAVDEVFGPETVLCGNAVTARMVEAKGHATIQVPADYIDILRSTGIKTEVDVLNKLEIEGKEISPATPDVLEILDKVWYTLDKFKMQMGRPKPKVACFSQINESQGMFGYCLDDCVYVRTDISNGKSLNLLNTMIHEVAHYVTKARDFSTEFQEFAFKLSACLIMDAGV